MHPFDGIAATFINAVCAYGVFGCTAGGAAWGLLYAGLNNLYIHMDLRTPRWTGILFQRPEMHRVHHKRGHHAQNYGLPIWDGLFGTFLNPKERVSECGFEPDKEARIADMLRLRNLGA
jgi:sterol desaturase/sphingolipid hydroxylase (fatty acid hydroxylase superfamily)